LGHARLAADQANAKVEGRWLVFADESGVSLTPPVRTTWAPRGRTPVVRYRQGHRQHVSMAGLLCYRPDGSRARLLFGFQPGAYDSVTLKVVLDRLECFLGGAPVTLIWDNLPAHHSRDLRGWVAEPERDWLKVEYLPAYAPELNPAEGVWASLKGTELANLCARTTDEVIATAQVGLFRIRREQELLFGFLRHTGLTI
jgi:transposase